MQQTSSARPFSQRFIAAVVALVLALGLAPHAAWADGAAASDGTFSVALTIVDTTDSENGVLANVKIDGLTAENTVADLLAKAGFTKGEQEESASKSKVYYDSYGSPAFAGKAYDSATGNYWVTMYDGDSAKYDSAQLEANLQKNGHYQYIYTSASTFTYSDKIADPLASTTPDPDPAPAPAADVNVYDAATASTLQSNLEKRFSTGGADASISNNTYAAAVALNSLGLGASVDSSAILANMNSQASEMTAGRMGKFIMALTAAGVDCTKVEDNGTTRNLVAEMEALEASGSVGVYDAVCILPVYQYGSYTQAAGLTENELIDVIVSSADSEGLFGNAQWGCDTQTTAQGILALAPYAGDATVDAAIANAKSALLKYENADGSFGYSASYNTANLDATATIVAALEALGVDAASDASIVTENGSSPLGYLVAQADEALDGYLDASDYDEPQTSAAVLMALAAHAGAQQAGGAYSVYTLQKASKETPAEQPEREAATQQTAATLAKTADGTNVAGVLAVCALSAAACAVAATRRAREVAYVQLSCASKQKDRDAE